MHAPSFFLQRAIARGADWQLAYPALALASSTDSIDEKRKQIVVAAADTLRLRMVFFSSLGAVLDFQATWPELSNASSWLGFTLRWNRWWLPDTASQQQLAEAAYAPTDVRIANRPIAGDLSDDVAFRAYLTSVETKYRRDASISRVLFPANDGFVNAFA
jgi:hypothetical protein